MKRRISQQKRRKKDERGGYSIDQVIMTDEEPGNSGARAIKKDSLKQNPPLESVNRRGKAGVRLTFWNRAF